MIASVTEPFCESCDRVRLTAEGQLRNCLFALDEYDLRGPLRAGASDDELAALIEPRRSRPSGPATRSTRCSSSGPGGA